MKGANHTTIAREESMELQELRRRADSNSRRQGIVREQMRSQKLPARKVKRLKGELVALELEQASLQSQCTHPEEAQEWDTVNFLERELSFSWLC